jgi:acetate kinase
MSEACVAACPLRPGQGAWPPDKARPDGSREEAGTLVLRKTSSGADLDADHRPLPPGPGAWPLKILVINAGSTSLKRHLVDGGTAQPVDEYAAADAVGHRVVHGGARFLEPTLVDDQVIAAIEELRPLAPLHNEPALRAIRAAQAALPDASHVAVFDTAFHATIPDDAATYAIPGRWREDWGIRRYGFHGIAVQSVAEQVDAERLVVCHLGGGSSVTAVLRGRSVDTTMGFSPLEGVPMATRSGSVDPGALIYLLRERGLTVEGLDAALEHESGLAALGGLDDPLGFGVYTYRIAAAVAQMATALGGLDLLAFSGGVGENREDVRAAIADRVGYFGEFQVEVVPAREELVIAAAVETLRRPSSSKASLPSSSRPEPGEPSGSSHETA